MDRQRGRELNGRMDRQTERPRQAESWMDRFKDRQTDRQRGLDRQTTG